LDPINARNVTAGAGGIGSMRRGYGAGRVRDGNARGAERLVG